MFNKLPELVCVGAPPHEIRQLRPNVGALSHFSTAGGAERLGRGLEVLELAWGSWTAPTGSSWLMCLTPHA